MTIMEVADAMNVANDMKVIAATDKDDTPAFFLFYSPSTRLMFYFDSSGPYHSTKPLNQEEFNLIVKSTTVPR